MFFSKCNCDCGDTTPIKNNVVSKNFNGRYHIIRYNADDGCAIKKGYNTHLKVGHNPIYNVYMNAQPIDESTQETDIVQENDSTTISGATLEKLQLQGMKKLSGANLKRAVNTTAPANNYGNGVFWLSTQNLEVNADYKLYVMCNILTVPYTNYILFHLNTASGSDRAFQVSVNDTGLQLLEIDFTNKLNSANTSRRSFAVCLNGCEMDIIGLFYVRPGDVLQYNYNGTTADIKISENDVVLSDDLTVFDLSYKVPIERCMPAVRYQNINPNDIGSVNNNDFNDFYNYYQFCQLDENNRFFITNAKLEGRTISGLVSFNVDRRSTGQTILLLANGRFYMPTIEEDITDIKQMDIVFVC